MITISENNLVLSDFQNTITHSNKNNKNKNKRLILLVLLVVLIILSLFAFDSRLKIQAYSIYSDKLVSSFNIVLVTDLHSCKYGDNQSELITAIKSEKPSVILLGGDICDDIMPNTNTENLLKGIKDICPIYYVTGNHEYWSDDLDAILSLFESYDVTILNGENSVLDINGNKINICGVSDPCIATHTDSSETFHTQINEVSQTVKENEFSILLSHRPELVDIYKQYNFDLVLSGHAHGGQWRIPGILNGLYAPNQGLFPKYAGGEYTLDDTTTMIVSRGLARETTRIPRIFNRPELVTIKLNSK